MLKSPASYNIGAYNTFTCVCLYRKYYQNPTLTITGRVEVKIELKLYHKKAHLFGILRNVLFFAQFQDF